MNNKIKEKFNEMLTGLVSQRVITESQQSALTPLCDLFTEQIEAANKKSMKAAKAVVEAEKAEYDAQISEAIKAVMEENAKLTETKIKLALAEQAKKHEEEVKAAAKEAEAATDEAVKEYDQQVKEELQEVFESIQKHNELSTKLAISEAVKENEAKIVESVSNYLNIYIDELLPESLVVDYDRLHKLEGLFESFKKELCVNDKMVESYTTQLKESVEVQQATEQDTANAKIAELEAQVQELMQKCSDMKTDLKLRDREAALDDVLQDVPPLEASKVRRYFESEDADAEDIKAQAADVLALVKKLLATQDIPDIADDEVGGKIEAIISGTDETDDAEDETEDEVEEEETEEIDATESAKLPAAKNVDSITESVFMNTWVNKANLFS